MAGPWLLACKELGGIIYVAQLGPTQPVPGGYAPGTPTVWFPIGPGLRPSIQEYNGTSFILTFEYLSHLFTRVINVGNFGPPQPMPYTPPTTVNPVQTSGGPNPPNPYEYLIQLSQDSLALKTESSVAFGRVENFLPPPILNQPTIFDDPSTSPATYSATFTLNPSYNPMVPPGYTPYYRLYRRTFTPTIGPWTILPISPSTNNWQANALNYTDSQQGSLRYQYSATLGVGFNYTEQWDPNQHNESIVGFTYITVDSTVGHLSFQLFLNDSLTMGETSFTAYSIMDERQIFIVETASDEIPISRSLIGQSSDAFAYFGPRGAFIFVPPVADTLTYPEMGGVVAGANNFHASTFALQAYVGA